MYPRKEHPIHCRPASRLYLLSLGLWEEWDLKETLEGLAHLQDRAILWHQVWSLAPAARR